MKNITVVIIAKNEETMINDCLKSLEGFENKLLVDTGSTDKTNVIAKKYNPAITHITRGSFADWRNKGMKEIKTDWVLYLDADERMTKELKKEIESVVNGENNLFAYAIPRRNIILGKELKHGGWYPDYQKRMFYKPKFSTWKGDLHEEPFFEGELGHLKNPMVHIKHESFSEMVEKTNNWSDIEARLMFDSKHPPMNIPRFLSAMGREFWHRMIIKRAFFDGTVGISFALYQVFSRFVSYAKLWELQINSKK